MTTGETFTGADILRDLHAIERRPVFFDENAGGWCYRLPDRAAPVQAESWAAAWAAVNGWYATNRPAVVRRPPAPVAGWRRWLGL